MSVVAYTGLPGSGKSYGVVENVILPCLLEGRPIVTNLPLKLGEIQKWCVENNAPTPRIELMDIQAVADSDSESFTAQRYGAVHVWDEVWRIWPSGMKANQAQDGHQEYFAEHRHQVDAAGRSTEIVLVTQDLSQLASWVRNFVDETFRAQKLNHIGQDNKYRIDVYMGPVTGPKPPVSRRIREFYGSYKPKVYNLYQSATKAQQSGMHGAGKEQKADKRANKLRSPAFLASIFGGPVLLVACGYFAFNTLVTGFGQADQASQLADQSKPEPAVVHVPEGVTPPQSFGPRQIAARHADPEPRHESQLEEEQKPSYPDPDDGLPDPSRKWQLVGEVGLPSGDFVVVQNRVGYRYIDPSLCHDYTGGFSKWCIVDGERVDRTTGPRNGSFGTAAQPVTM